jgi:hypothetical protein
MANKNFNKPVSSSRYLQFTPIDIHELEKTIETKGKYNCDVNYDIPLIIILEYLKKAVKIVENTDSYTEYLLFETFGNKKLYNKTPPGTIRVYAKSLICFWNGRNWRKLK